MSYLPISPTIRNTTIPAGNTIANTNIETAFTSVHTISANTVNAGDILRIRLWGVYGTSAIAPTIQGKVKVGSTTVLDTGAVTGVINVNSLGWSANINLLILNNTSAGVVDAQGYLEFATAATTALSVNASNTSTFNVDFTTDQLVTITVTWSAASASNTIQLRQFSAEHVRASI